MIEIAVVENSAETRTRLVARIESYLSAQVPGLDLLPQISVRPFSPAELKFHAHPDICILGARVLQQDLALISSLREILVDTPIIAELSDALSSLQIVEQLARLGVNDTFDTLASPEEFLRKIVIFSHKRPKESSGKLIVVDSGKGGLGVTSIVAGLGESIAARQHSVVLVDLDFETQCLSRFLQVRPYFNENLELLLNRERAVNPEIVQSCLVPVWQDVDNLYCIPPVSDCDALHDRTSPIGRVLLAVFESLDSKYDYVIVDLARSRGPVRQVLLRSADHYLLVLKNDPAALFASVERLAQAKLELSQESKIALIENAPSPKGLSAPLLRKEISRAAKLEPANWLPTRLPLCSEASRWPGSGGTLYSLGSRRLRKAFDLLSAQYLDPSAVEAAPPTRSMIRPRIELPKVLRQGGKRTASIEPHALPEPRPTEQNGLKAITAKPQISVEFTQGNEASRPEAQPSGLISAITFDGSPTNP